MIRDLTEEDVNTPVMTAAGERVGTVLAGEGGRVCVEPTEELVGQTQLRLGWGEPEDTEDGSYELRDEQIDTIDENEVRLREFESEPESELEP